MLEIKSFTFGPFQTNTYVVLDGQGNALLIDPACCYRHEQEQLAAYLQPYALQAVLATHGHLDHLWGAHWASEHWHMPVRLHDADRPMVDAMQMQYDMFGIRMTAEPFETAPLTGNFAGCMQAGLQVIETPGHTPGSVCLFWEKEKVLLSGDTLFCAGFGRTDLPGGDVQALITSLQHLLRLPEDTQVYPGHGQKTVISDERTSLRSIFRNPLT